MSYIALVTILHSEGGGSVREFSPGDAIPAGLLPSDTAARLEQGTALVRANSPEARIITTTPGGSPTMKDEPGTFFVAVHARALCTLRVVTRSNVELTIPPGAVFAADPGESGRAWRAGLVEPLGAVTTGADVSAFVAMRPGFEREALDDLRAHGGRQFKTLRSDYVTRIERAPKALPAARPIVLNLGGRDPSDTPLPPDAFC